MLGDDGNLMQADGNSFPVFILGVDDWGKWGLNFSCLLPPFATFSNVKWQKV